MNRDDIKQHEVSKQRITDRKKTCNLVINDMCVERKGLKHVLLH